MVRHLHGDLAPGAASGRRARATDDPDWRPGIRGLAHQVEHLGQSHVFVGDVEADRNPVEIDFFGLSHDTGERLTCQYRLEGTDSAWTAPAAERRVNFAELAPGAYRFAVRAVNTDGQASPLAAPVAFTILKPVWQRWWFLATSALLVFASGYAGHRYRVGRLLEIERLRTRIASDLHDDVGSSLTQISILSEIVPTYLGHPEPVSESRCRGSANCLARR